MGAVKTIRELFRKHYDTGEVPWESVVDYAVDHLEELLELVGEVGELDAGEEVMNPLYDAAITGRISWERINRASKQYFRNQRSNTV